MGRYKLGLNPTLLIALTLLAATALPVGSQDVTPEEDAPTSQETVPEETSPDVPGSSRMQPTEPPAGTESLGASWVLISPGSGTFLAAIARPPGDEPAPLVVIFHGTHGFAHQYVKLAQDLAESAGVIAVAPCWFGSVDGAPPPPAQSPRIACPDAPPAPGGVSPASVQRLSSLLGVLRNLSGLGPDRIALFGHSRGASAALNYSVSGRTPRAVMLSGGGYPTGTLPTLQGTKSPLLILHGTNDNMSNSGSPDTVVGNARALEAAVRANGGTVEANYVQGAVHNDVWLKPSQYAEWLQLMQDFLARYL